MTEITIEEKTVTVNTALLGFNVYKRHEEIGELYLMKAGMLNARFIGLVQKGIESRLNEAFKNYDSALWEDEVNTFVIETMAEISSVALNHVRR